MEAEIQGYFDKNGLISQWPSARKKKLMVLQYLAAHFDDDRDYTEAEVNEILKRNLSYNDHVLIRRELFGSKLLDRTPDGRRYWRLKRATPIK